MELSNDPVASIQYLAELSSLRIANQRLIASSARPTACNHNAERIAELKQPGSSILSVGGLLAWI